MVSLHRFTTTVIKPISTTSIKLVRFPFKLFAPNSTSNPGFSHLEPTITPLCPPLPGLSTDLPNFDPFFFGVSSDSSELHDPRNPPHPFASCPQTSWYSLNPVWIRFLLLLRNTPPISIIKRTEQTNLHLVELSYWSVQHACFFLQAAAAVASSVTGSWFSLDFFMMPKREIVFN